MPERATVSSRSETSAEAVVGESGVSLAKRRAEREEVLNRLSM